MSPWKILLQSYIEKYGGDKILYFKKWGLESISDKINPFWRNIYFLIYKFVFHLLGTTPTIP
jgi:hypothetical protein